MAEARNHHYLSQCYLKWFTQGSSKNSKLHVFDLKNKKKFETIPRNVGGIRDFNRIDVEGVDPNIVEKNQAEFEKDVATALNRLNDTLEFSGETKNLILSLIGMLAIKSPQMREHLAGPLNEMAGTIAKMNFENGLEDLPDDLKDVYDIVDGKPILKKEVQIHMELMGMERITQLLHARGWTLVRVGKDAGEFITTDNPVSLTFNKREMNNFLSPGFGVENTMVYFPVSKNLALVGEFGKKDGVSIANSALVSMLNSKIISNSYQRLFSASDKFQFIAKGGIVSNGQKLFN